MGETLGIAHNVFEKIEREKDRKERLKKYEEWQKTKVKKQQKIAEIKAKIKEAEASNNGNRLAQVAEPEVSISQYISMSQIEKIDGGLFSQSSGCKFSRKVWTDRISKHSRLLKIRSQELILKPQRFQFMYSFMTLIL